ncbi:MAG: DUF1304 domain-containing protein [Proteobacteria bacterium]|jgi:putative membrane protein|nr:DUF1304 domain-containing protein [Pseudomonadota bacterium]
MTTLATVLVALVALEHLGILYLEMFAWTSLGPKVFKGALARELFAPTRVMAANQGLYNGFLAAGLIWSLCIGDAAWQVHVARFFLGCVLVAGVYGALTASRRILYVQALPAALGLLALL